MSIQLYRLEDSAVFPPTTDALQEPNGLLAYGGDLSVERLVCAYSNGIFPWYSVGEPLLWWSPDPRGVLFLDQYSPSKSLLKQLKKNQFEITINKSFEEVIQACASVPRHDQGTWITKEMIQAYINLHRAGFGHSIEVWQHGALAGGLYGVCLGNLFCGESMFHVQSNASKIAFYALVKHMRQHGAKIIDCQMQTEHLASMGVTTIDRSEFINVMRQEISVLQRQGMWKQQNITHLVSTPD